MSFMASAKLEKGLIVFGIRPTGSIDINVWTDIKIGAAWRTASRFEGNFLAREIVPWLFRRSP